MKFVRMGMEMGMGMGMGIGIGGEQKKKKRGRPRKYVTETDVSHIPLSSPQSQSQPQQQQQQSQLQLQPQQQQQSQLQAQPQQQQQQSFLQPQQQQQQQQQSFLQSQSQQQQQHVAAQSQPQAGGSPPTTMKKARGRPPGTGKKHQLETLGSLGIGFTPHVITVNTGEDVASRIMSFSQSGPRAVCILSAIGAISNVTLHQATTSGGSVTYEGRFEILSLSGSFMLSDGGGPRSRTGGLSVSLAGPDGRVLGGGVAGLLIAASPVQVVVGSFIADSHKEPKIGNMTEPLFGSAKPHTATGQMGPSSPPSRGTLSESSGGPGSPLNQSTGAVNSIPLGMSNLPWK